MPSQFPFTPDFFPGAANGSVPNVGQDSAHPETNLALPWTTDPAASWLDYRCWVEVELDAGMALHKPLPQSNPSVDTLATDSITNDNLDASNPATGGVNIQSSSGATDILQRMASSTYTFILKGWGLRAGYQVPVPGLKSVGGQTATPEGRQWTSGNVVVGNLAGGIPMYFCQWRLRYVITQTPKSAGAEAPVPHNPALHIRGDAPLPSSVALPFTQTDDNAINPAAVFTGNPAQLPGR